MFVHSCLFWARHRWIAATLLVLLASFPTFWARHVSFSSRLSDYYPNQHPHVKLYREFTDMLKMTNTALVTVTVREGTIFTSDVLGKIHRLTVGLLETKGVNPYEVLSLTHPRLKNITVRTEGISILPLIEHPDQPQSPAELIHIKKAVYTNLGIRGVYISPDEKTALIRAGFWDGMAEPHAVLTRLQTLAAQEQDANTDIVFTGNLVLAAWLIEAAPGFQLFLLIGAGVALLLLGCALGFIRGACSVLLVNFIGVIWGLSFLDLSGCALNPLALVTFFPLCIRGIALVTHWRVSLADGYTSVATPFAHIENREQVLRRTASVLGWPLTIALVIDAISLLTLILSDVPAMQALGYLSLGWITGLLLSLWLLLPFWSSTPLFSQNTPTASRAWGSRLTEHCVAFFLTPLRRPAISYGGVILLTLLGFVALVQLQAGRSMLGTTLFSTSHPFNRAFAVVNDKFIGANQLIVIAHAPGEAAFRDPKALEALEAFQHYMANDEQLGGSVAITGLIKSLTGMFHEKMPKWEVIPTDIDSAGQVIFRLIASATTPNEVERFLSTDYHTTTVTFFYKSYSPEVVEHALQRIQAFIAQQQNNVVEFYPGGGILGVLSAVDAAVEQIYWRFFGALVLGAALGGLLSGKSLRSLFGMGLAALLSQGLLLTVLWIGRIDLNVYTLPAIVVCAGTILIPAMLMFMNNEISSFQASGFVITSMAAAAASIAWMFSPSQLQADVGVLFLSLALGMTVIPLLLHRQSTPEARGVTTQDVDELKSCERTD